MNTETKRLAGGLSFKDGAAAGTLEAVFATFNVVDHDGDVTLPGAFGNGAEVVIGSWGHKTAEPPIGKGVIRTNAIDARVEGKLFLGAPQGSAAYETLKQLGPLAQWSYVFRVVKQSFGSVEGRQVRFLEGVEVFSVDPVLAGAGVGTRTVGIKEAGSAFTAAERAEIIAIKERNEVRMAFAEAKVTCAGIPTMLEYTEVLPWPNGSEVRAAADAGIEMAADRLGIPVPALKWFSQPRTAKEQLAGFTWKESAVVWIRDDPPAPEAAFFVCAHEMKHRAQPPGMDHQAAEDDADAFAFAMLEELRVRA